MRKAGLTDDEAVPVMASYCAQVPRGTHVYLHRETTATLRSVYRWHAAPSLSEASVAP